MTERPTAFGLLSDVDIDKEFADLSPAVREVLKRGARNIRRSYELMAEQNELREAELLAEIEKMPEELKNRPL